LGQLFSLWRDPERGPLRGTERGPQRDKIICKNEGLHQQPEMLSKKMPLDPDNMRNGAMHDIHNRRWRNEEACETTAARQIGIVPTSL
jgi:hypothetical protein